MKPWWDKLTKSKGIFCDDTYSCCFPSSGADYVDDEIEGEDVSLPDFDKAGWNGLQREEFSLEEVEVMWYMTSAKVVRWVGSDTNRMEIRYASSGNWYFACQQGENFYSVAVIGSHPEVHCNAFTFGNSDGSSSYGLKIADYVDPHDTVQEMMGIAMGFVDDQQH